MKHPDHRPRVILYDMEGFCLIVVHKSGVVYQNQVCGTVSYQAEQEGVLAPVTIEGKGAQAISAINFALECVGIDENTADLLDVVFRSDRGTEFISVDRSRLDESCEAWIYVRLDGVPREYRLEGDTTYFGPIYGFTNGLAVLTWRNSD